MTSIPNCIETPPTGAFTASSRPRALLRMPHCLPAAVNAVHYVRFGGQYPILESEEDYELLVTSKTHNVPMLCYCEGIRAMIALERRHCTFELLWDALPEAPLPGEWLSGIEFVRAAGNRHGELRKYELLYTWARRVAPDLLEAVLLPFRGPVLWVAGSPQDGQPPEALDLLVRLDDADLLPGFHFTVEPERAPHYLAAERELVQAQALCREDASRARQYLLEWTSRIPGGEYPQINTLVTALLADDPDGVELQCRIDGLRQYLWDATAVEGADLRRRLQLHNGASLQAATGPSTARSLLKFAGTWAGDDIDQCLADAYATRSPVRF